MKPLNTSVPKIVSTLFFIVLICAIGFQQFKTFEQFKPVFIEPIKFKEEHTNNDWITNHTNKYKELHQLFPNATHFCYIGEEGDDFPTWSMHYCLSQYSLAPNVLIKNKTDCDTILYNLHWNIHMDYKKNYHLNNGWHIVKDFNNGLIVLAK